MRDSKPGVSVRSRSTRFLVWFMGTGVFITVLLVICWFRLGPQCAALLANSRSDVAIPLPPDCAQTNQVKADEMVAYFDRERIKRGLAFKAWVVCSTNGQTALSRFGFDQDSRWLPSYAPNTFQFRRSVVILPFAQPVPKGSPVIAALCVVSWRKYISQVAGQCDGKFSIWK